MLPHRLISQKCVNKRYCRPKLFERLLHVNNNDTARHHNVHYGLRDVIDTVDNLTWKRSIPHHGRQLGSTFASISVERWRNCIVGRYATGANCSVGMFVQAAVLGESVGLPKNRNPQSPRNPLKCNAWINIEMHEIRKLYEIHINSPRTSRPRGPIVLLSI